MIDEAFSFSDEINRVTVMARSQESFALKPNADRYGRVVGFIGWFFAASIAAFVLGDFLDALRQFSREEPMRRTNLCMDNLKNLSVAFSQYVGDNDTQFPVGEPAVTPSSDRGLGWTRQIAVDTRSNQNYQCPDDATQPRLPGQRVVSYGYNRNLAERPSASGLTSPKNTVLLFEVSDDVCFAALNPTGSTARLLQSSASGDGTSVTINDGLSPPRVRYATGAMGARPSHTGPWPKPRHLSGQVAAFLFADGHVHWSLPRSISTGTNAVHPADGQTGTVTGHAAGTENRSYHATFSTR